MYTDNYLIKKAQAGDMGAFEQLLHKYDRHVLNIATSFRNNEDDAKDIYQEVFIRVFNGLKSFEYRSEFSTWLYRITTNVCISYKSKKQRHYAESLDRNIGQDDESRTSLSDTIAGSDKTNKPIENSELGNQIYKALETLPTQQKLAFTLKHYQGHKIKEIAQMMGCKEGTIKRYLFTATNKMKEKLAPLMSL